MDIITTSLEALIQRATNINNQGPDTAAIDAFCGLINKEPECAQIAAKFVSAKVQSLQEWEALQALLVLESCMKRCGSVFHSEVGKFRFLNELIKLVSPKYMGAHTPEAVRRRVLELMYSWTIQYPKETKIKEAYDMLKKQGVVKEEPQLSIREARCKDQPSILQDEEKSLLLQKLLKSKNPDDLQAANRLIKSMVKEDERRVEEKWRQAAELETAVNNCRLLKEMLENWDPVNGSQEDLDLIKELHSACLSLSPVLHRLAGSTSDTAFCESVIAANDELGEVFAKYSSIMKTTGEAEDSSSSLLDLTPSPTKASVDDTANHLANLGLDLGQGISNAKDSSSGENSSINHQSGNSRSLLDDIFGSPPPAVSSTLVLPQASANSAISIEKSVPSTKENTKSKGLEELDLLSKSLLEENLLLSKNAQNKKPHKVSMNELSLLTSSDSSSVSSAVASASISSLIENDLLGLNSLKEVAPLPAENTIDVLAEKQEPVNNTFSSAPATKEVKSDQEPQVLPLGDIKVTLETVKPSSIPPFTAIDEKNGVSVAIFLAKDRPRADVSVFVVSTSSKNQFPLQNFLFQPVVPKCCRLRLLPSSSTTLPAHNPFLPPSAITQIMLIASPTKVPIVLKFVISYVMEEETFTELGEICDLPLVEN